MANWGRILSRGQVEDRRSMAPLAIGGSLTTLALYALVTYLSGGNLSDVLSQLPAIDVSQQDAASRNTAYEGNDEYEVFASTVLGSNNDLWKTISAQENTSYEDPKLVLFRTSTQSACGGATADVGPHYCPLDNTIYLDETFFDELTSRFGAKGGDVAQAYVIAHEVGHHAQQELGIMEQAQNLSSSQSDNDASIKLELQADCFAGLWANSVKNQGVFEAGEIQEAIDAAAAVGDDRIQQKVTGQISPETWTHGSSAQRVEWFNRGYTSGTITSCDTFQ